ncbi:MAG: TetR family transcriptional regulator [Solirubrobacteraceae bacterium]
MAEIQRARLLDGAVRAVDEFGYARTTVTEITARAHVSRRTFYELFDSGEDCLAAMFDRAIARIRSELAGAGLDGLAWRERVRGGLWTVLSFLDREPVLVRVLVVQFARGGPGILERRERLLSELVGVIDQSRMESASKSDCPALTAEGLVGAVVAIVYTRLLRGEPVCLRGLQGELMAMIVLPYLGPAAARAERKRSIPNIMRTVEGDGDGSLVDMPVTERNADPLGGLSIRLTYRTVCVLEALSEHPGLSNRAVADASGVSDQGQASKLLARLERYGLLKNRRPVGKGEANAWSLTSTGEQIAQIVHRSARERHEPVATREIADPNTDTPSR